MPTEQQIEKVALAISTAVKKHRPTHDESLAMARAAIAAVPAPRAIGYAVLDTPDPELVTWTPKDGPLADALAGLPDGHPVTIVRTLPGKVDRRAIGGWVALDSTATSASWKRSAPAWDGALVLAIRGDDDVLWRTSEGHYSFGANTDGDWTPTKLLQDYGDRIYVLIDADGNHVGGDDE